MKNPDKYIRKAFITGLLAEGITAYDQAVPKTVSPVQYVVITSQTKIEVGGKGCRSWDCTIVLDLFVIQPLSYVSSVAIEDMEEKVLNAFQTKGFILVDNFKLSAIRLDGTPRSLPIPSDTQSISRKVMTYRLLVTEII